MQPITSIADLPFREWDQLALLNLSEHRDTPDDDYYEYGYSRFEKVCLLERNSPEPLPLVYDALLLALHSADEGEELADDVELEFFVEEVADDYSVTVLLSDFLSRWLPRVSGSERAIVLAMCNPYRATVSRPAIAANTPVYYALGDVESWVEFEGNRPFMWLTADRWLLAE